jgi:hypothetical protein
MMIDRHHQKNESDVELTRTRKNESDSCDRLWEETPHEDGEDGDGVAEVVVMGRRVLM